MTSLRDTSVPAYIADYRVVRILGQGNSGRVYLAGPPKRLGRTEEFVAVKVFNGPCPDPAYDRAVEELRAVSSLPSPYLASVFEIGLAGSSLFYASEYHAMGSLAAPGRPLTPVEVLLAIVHAAHAAHAMHEAGIAHAAIKPQNVLIGPRSALLADLGLGRQLRPGLTTGIATSGSVEYLDPAVLRGAAPSRSSEVWALGATLHRTMSGVGLYGELSDAEPLRAIRTVMSASPSISGNLSPRVSALIQACLVALDRRIPTAAVLQQQLLELVREGRGLSAPGDLPAADPPVVELAQSGGVAGGG